MPFDQWFNETDFQDAEVEQIARAAWDAAVGAVIELLELQGKHQSASLIRDELGYE